MNKFSQSTAVFRSPERFRKSVSLYLRIFAAGLVLMLAGGVVRGQITQAQALASLKTNRDRLIGLYAQQHGYASGAQAWSYLTTSQKGVFLTITDLLGRRTFMTPEYSIVHDFVYQGDEDDQGFGCTMINEPGSSCNDGCYVHPPNYYGPACLWVSGQSCHDFGKCTDSPTVYPRENHDMALNHVTQIYAINGSNNGACGGIDNNRIFFHADDDLIYAIRNTSYPFPEFPFPNWRTSTDPFGPHSPFTQSKETDSGYPRGQSQEWAWDYEASTLARPGVYGIYDPHVVEMDIDYFAIGHPSNPECSYGGVYGRTFYENYWYSRGLGGPAEYNYQPPGGGKQESLRRPSETKRTGAFPNAAR
ncbi:MAG: hypothetical protein JSS81_19280 [Acidobacteria bacterium]|nr:hypothetical protein [Acidobacteriota bacterium]